MNVAPSATGSKDAPSSDNALAVRAAAGSSEAFEALARRYQPRLFRFVEPKCHRTGFEADDVVQESIIKAWSAIGSYDASRSFAVWIYTIAHRQTIDHARRQKRRPAESLDARGSDQVAASAIEDRDGPSIEDRDGPSVDAENMWQRARDVLHQDAYAALWLRYGEGFAIADIARTLDRTRVATRVTLHRARQTLRENLHPSTNRPPQSVNSQLFSPQTNQS